ncbi:Hsp70 family protein [Stackebrandtia endophytica]|uniref:Hsp70 family protein n=1 Tax=Stackebrandtia endophytica TaxID=1496996 RepID=UPI001B8746EF|nr:Hsp70 family protein [Stackebrandtia endophytica]
MRFEPNPKRRVDDGSILLGDNECDVVTVFAAVLGRVRDECVRVAGHVPATTLTHPATWGSARRMVLEDAATAAGFPDVRIRAEPVAAATYFARQTDVDLPVGSAVVVFDFGGGTFDVSVVRRTTEEFEVLSVDGVDDLGGVDIDHRLMEHLGRQFSDAPEWNRLMQPAAPEDRRGRRTFVDDVRSVKEQLSRHARADLLIPLVNRETHLTREELEQVTGPMLERAMRVTTAVIRASRLESGQVAGVFLVGGASRMPLVATLLHRHTGIAPTVIDQPELVVAHGATLEPAQPTPPQRQTVSSPPTPSGISPEDQRPELPHPDHRLPSGPVPPPHPPLSAPAAVTAPASGTDHQQPDERQPWALKLAKIAVWAQVLALLAGSVVYLPSFWSAVLLLASIAGAITVTRRRRSRLHEAISLGSQYLVIGLTYWLVFVDSWETVAVAVLLLTEVMAISMLHAAAGWFSGVSVRRSVWWLKLTKVLMAGQFALLVFVGVFPMHWTADNYARSFAADAAEVVPFYIAVVIGAGFAFWGLMRQPPMAWGWWTAVLMRCYLVGAALLVFVMTGGHLAVVPLVAAVGPSVAIISLVIAARRFYLRPVEGGLDVEPKPGVPAMV